MAELAEPFEGRTLTDRKEELQTLRSAIERREPRLVWGPKDSGKTALIKKAISELSDKQRQSCICWAGAASGRRLLSHFVAQLFEVGDPFVRKKVHTDGATETSLRQWLRRQTSLRLRGILLTASRQGHYRFFLDDFPPATHNMARLLKEMIYRCDTPVYLVARGHSQDVIGYAWSLYWNDTLRVHLGPLNDRVARELLESCIRSLHLDSLDLGDFREDLLRLSGHLPGSIVKMCKLAAHSRYHYGNHIKIKLVHVDYLIESGPSGASRAAAFLQ